ncbi:hypothetical protein E1200_23070 [Actinomadura sp. GC306]|uniref:hypothetical protein n=1 Tax=Actinomadura sp. GC306 TaxID=2530367 RepID=UPI0010531A14|nr:hypothetical protein [Actinomadura sp. GC306]TDC63229.1 hypothetical protein E1200_23070 [Actinomadura sp. GC306]
MTVEPREICTGRNPGEDDTTAPATASLGADAPRDPLPVAVSGELAARVRVLRRARRDAETRASRVRRVLLAPTAPAAGTPVRVPRPHRH